MSKCFFIFFCFYLFSQFPFHIAHAADDPDTPVLENTVSDPELIAELKKGGYILYFRHGITNHDTFDTDRNNLKNCNTQRLLSDEGREQMKRIGNVVKQLKINIGDVVSSPYCRSIDTATLAFGETAIDEYLKHTVTASEETVKKQAQALSQMLSKIPEREGSNDIISGHTANLQEATGIWPKPEGVAIVFKPKGNGLYEYIATIHPDHWEKLLEIDKN